MTGSGALRATSRCSVLLLGLLWGCSAPDDPTFGRSYDVCVLKNAVNGGDEQSRATAADICARHFLRAADAVETTAVRGEGVVDFAAAPVGMGTSAGTVGGAALESATAPTADTISADVTNESANLIVKRVELEAEFHGQPPDKYGKWKTGDRKQNLIWYFDVTIEPGETQNVTGSFEGDHAPSHYYHTFISASMVVPHSDKPPKLLREGSD